MTYINLVNAVLRKLREDEVSTLTETDYSKLVGDFVNDALTSVEASWDWSCLRETITVTTTQGVKDYSLSGFGNSSELMYMYDVTNKNQLLLQSKAYIDDKHYRGTGVEANPKYFCMKGVDGNGDMKIILYPIPATQLTLEASVARRGVQLVNDNDSTLLPRLPIIQYAFAYALRERGETGGQSASEQLVIAQRDLSNAIALDAGNNANELVFIAV